MRLITCISIPKIWPFWACLLLSLFFSRVVNAAYIHPTWSPHNAAGTYSTPQAGLNAAQDVWELHNGSSPFCHVWSAAYWGSENGFYASNLSGCGGGGVWAIPSCPTGYNMDNVKHMCWDGNNDPDPEPSTCESKTGQTISWGLIVPNYVTAGHGLLEFACVDSCRVSLGNFECNAANSQDGSGYCNGLATFTGGPCTSGDPSAGPPVTDPDLPPDPEPEPPVDCGPDHTWSGTTCAPNEPEPPCDPATETCPPPGDGGDGGDGDGDGGDGDGDGDGGDGDGDGDGGGGDGDGGDGDGEGDGECNPLTDPNQCKVSSVAGEACNVALACTGDAVQCAILRAQKKQLCADEDFRDMSSEKVADMRSALDSEFSKANYQPLTPGAERTFNLAGMIDTSSRFSKACPVIPPISFQWIDGSSQSIPVGEVFTQLCPYLVWFGYLLVAFAMRRAAEIIAQGMV